ncbi:hypothetical protein D3C76_1661010 [compost metagenome]
MSFKLSALLIISSSIKSILQERTFSRLSVSINAAALSVESFLLEYLLSIPTEFFIEIVA